jgi:hypothetical protein
LQNYEVAPALKTHWFELLLAMVVNQELRRIIKRHANNLVYYTISFMES